MLEKSFRYKHINECSKPKVPKAKPIEQLIEEKKIAQETPVAKSKAKSRPIAKKVAQPTTQSVIEAPPKNQFWEQRRQHTNLLNDKKQAAVKKNMAKAF
jgi:hypothetical protein